MESVMEIVKFINLREVGRRTGFSRTKIWRLRRENKFPDPYKGLGWLEIDLIDWQQSLIASKKLKN